MKKAGPSLRLIPPQTKPCENCGGTRIIEGLLHHMPCVVCNGMGVLDRFTGEQIDPVLVVEMKERSIADKDAEIARLKAKLPADDDHDPHKGMGERLGGKFRMD